MIVVDTSAIIAILRDEPEARAFAVALGEDPNRRMSAGSYLELDIVAGALGKPLAAQDVENFVARSGIEIVSFDIPQMRLAADAYRRFGKGRHRAGLNFGDCVSYALAKSLDAPLLCKGGDFARTDVAIWRP